MVKCKDVMSHMEELAPLYLACDWDTPGLLVGDGDKEISKILLCLDIDEAVAKEGEDMGADMIISHHPTMFTPVNHLTVNTPQERLLRMFCKSDICRYLVLGTDFSSDLFTSYS